MEEKNKTDLVRLRNQQKKSRVEEGAFKHCGCRLLAIFQSPIAPTKHINITTTKSGHSSSFVTLTELKSGAYEDEERERESVSETLKTDLSRKDAMAEEKNQVIVKSP